MKFYPIEKSGIIPVYIQLAEIIKKNIDEGRLKEGDLIPSELMFMKKYEISRVTVRNALLRLVYDGLLFKVHGRGTFVSSIDSLAITSPFDTLEKYFRDRGIKIKNELVEFVDVFPPDQIKIDLKLSPGEKAYKIKRIVKLEDKPIGMRTLFVPLPIGKMLKDKDLESQSLLHYINQDKRSRVTRMEIRIQAASIMDIEKDFMGVKEDSTVLVRSLIMWNSADKPVIAGRILYLSQYIGLKMEIVADNSKGQYLIETPAIDLV